MFEIAGVHGAEEVQHDADVEDHRRVHRRGHLEQPPAATTAESSRGTPDLDQVATRSPKHQIESKLPPDLCNTRSSPRSQ